MQIVLSSIIIIEWTIKFTKLIYYNELIELLGSSLEKSLEMNWSELTGCGWIDSIYKVMMGFNWFIYLFFLIWLIIHFSSIVSFQWNCCDKNGTNHVLMLYSLQTILRLCLPSKFQIYFRSIWIKVQRCQVAVCVSVHFWEQKLKKVKYLNCLIKMVDLWWKFVANICFWIACS